MGLEKVRIKMVKIFWKGIIASNKLIILPLILNLRERNEVKNWKISNNSLFDLYILLVAQ
jgi:hypothetical protein